MGFHMNWNAFFIRTRVEAFYVVSTQDLDTQILQRSFSSAFYCTQDLSPNFTLHLWVVENIAGNYESVPNKGPGKTNAHELRVIAALIAYYKKSPLNEISNLVGWKFTDVFSQHSLQDMAVEETPESVPMVAAGIGEQRRFNSMEPAAKDEQSFLYI